MPRPDPPRTGHRVRPSSPAVYGLLAVLWAATAAPAPAQQCNGSDLPSPGENTLLLVATEIEAGDLVSGDAAPCWQGGSGQAAYRFDNLTIAITGPTGHAMSSSAARLAAGPECGGGYARMINFGAVGVYPWSLAGGGTEVKKAYFVAESQQWDQFIPLRGYETFTRALELERPAPAPGAEAQDLVCLSGSRFSSDGDRSWPVFLAGDFEDLELYAVAWLAAALDLPLTAIKFVTNVVSPTGAEDFLANLPDAFDAGCELLLGALAQPEAGASPPSKTAVVIPRGEADLRGWLFAAGVDGPAPLAAEGSRAGSQSPLVSASPAE